MRIILASSSPRRKELLTKAGYDFEIIVKETDEQVNHELSVRENVKQIALKKAEVVHLDNKDAIVIGSDTIVVKDNIIYGKPKDREDAFNTLKLLNNTTHEVISGVAILYKDKVINYSKTSYVTFKNLSDDEINAYIDTGECFGKAGSYAIQGIGSSLVDHYEGEFENIVGLPIKSVSRHLFELTTNTFKIGDIVIPNRLVLAPMAGVCNESFRVLCKEMGAGLVMAEMVSDKAIGFKNAKTLKMTKVNNIEHPITMQIFGADIDSLVSAAKYICEYSDADIIDINMGCPVNKVAKKAKAGSSLLQDPNMVYEVTKAVVEASSKPVTVKIRIGWDENNINAVENAKMIEKAGAKAITVHGRTRSQFYSGKADYNVIKEVVEAVDIPVVGNGDVVDIVSAENLFKTGCSAIAIGRGSLGNPFIFRELNAYFNDGTILPKPSHKEILDTIIRQYKSLVELKGEHLALLEMRSHTTWYLKGLPNASYVRNIICRLTSFDEVLTTLTEYFNKLDNK